MSDGRHVAPFRYITLISSQLFFTLTPYIEKERRSVFHKLLMKTIEMLTTYIRDPINSVYNYVKYSVYFEILLYNGTNVSYTLDFQTITYHRLSWLRVTVLKLYYRHVAPFRYITLISNQPFFTLNP
jgi:hypothetical protein